SVPPGLVVTSVSKICAIARSDSPSLTYAPSSTTGSAEAPNTKVPPALPASDVGVPVPVPGVVVAPAAVVSDPATVDGGLLDLSSLPQAAMTNAEATPSAKNLVVRRIFLP